MADELRPSGYAPRPGLPVTSASSSVMQEAQINKKDYKIVLYHNLAPQSSRLLKEITQNSSHDSRDMSPRYQTFRLQRPGLQTQTRDSNPVT
jgi:hypothetical protein